MELAYGIALALLAVTLAWATGACAPPSAPVAEAMASVCQFRAARSQFRFVVRDRGAVAGGGNPGSNVGVQVQLFVGTIVLTLCHQQ